MRCQRPSPNKSRQCVPSTTPRNHLGQSSTTRSQHRHTFGETTDGPAHLMAAGALEPLLPDEIGSRALVPLPLEAASRRRATLAPTANTEQTLRRCGPRISSGRKDTSTPDPAACVMALEDVDSARWLSSSASSSRQPGHLPSKAPPPISGAPQSRQLTEADITLPEMCKTKARRKVTWRAPRPNGRQR